MRSHQAVPYFYAGVVKDHVAGAVSGQLERGIRDVVHDVANEVSGATQAGLGTQSHEAVGDAIAEDAAIPHGEIGLDRVVVGDGDVVVVNIVAELLCGPPVFHEGDAIAIAAHAVMADYVAGPGELDPLAFVAGETRRWLGTHARPLPG